MWFATLGGLDVYDGYEFRTIPSDPRRADSLTGVHVSRLYEDRQGNIWVAGFQGWLNRIAPDSGRIDHYSPELYGGQDGLISGPSAFLETADGTLYLGTVTGLHRYDAENNRFVRNVDVGPNSDPVGAVRSMAAASQGRIWLGTNQGLFRLNPASGEREHWRHEAERSDSLPSSSILSLLVDSSGRLWIGTPVDGLARLDPASGDIVRFSADPDRSDSLASNQVTDILQDSEGQVWVANQSGGLSRFLSESGGFEVYRNDPDNPESIPANDVWSLYEDRSGLLWIGTAGSGVSQINPARNRFDVLRHIPFNDNSLSSQFVWDLTQTADGRIWMATLAGLESYSPRTQRYSHFQPAVDSIASVQMQSVTADADGYIWLGGVDGTLYRFDPAREAFSAVGQDLRDGQGLGPGRIWNLLADGDLIWVTTPSGLYGLDRHSHVLVEALPAGERLPMGGTPFRVMLPAKPEGFWLGGGGLGLMRYVPGQGIVESWTHRLDQPDSLSHSMVRAIHVDESGGIWVGTLNGLNYLSPESRRLEREQFRLFTTSDGLPSNTIYGILPGVDGALWLSTPQGLARFDRSRETFEAFDVSDGLPSNEFNGGAELVTRDGQLYFGGVAGVAIVRPEALWRNDHVPTVAITGVEVRGERVAREDFGSNTPLSIPYAENDLTVEFAVMDFHQPEKNRFEYRLVGGSKAWTPSSLRRISFHRLSPGQYRFEVRGANNDGVWSESPATLDLSILPPWWRTNLAYTGYLIIGLALLLAYHLRQQRRLAEERRISDELQQAHSLAEANHQMALRHAQSDQLTQLPNRGALLEALARHMRKARPEKPLAVLQINLDRFQRINDSFGHAIGDRVLQLLARRFEDALEEGDFLARTGSDEFVWLTNLEEGVEPEQWLKDRCLLINRIVGERMEYLQPGVVMTASVGAAIHDTETSSLSATDLLSCADIALHQAKKRSEPPRSQLYQRGMDEAARQHLAIEARLKSALEQDEFSLRFQPLIAIESGRVRALEVLLRWQTGEGEFIPPDRFIPIAEQSGLIVDIGAWTIRACCRQISEWLRAGHPADFRVAVNVSMRQLRGGGFASVLQEATKEFDVPPSMLKVEITESMMMEHVEDTADQLEEIARLGVEISVDDFGTGFSSLSHLKLLPVSELKIDRAFVIDVMSSEQSRTIVQSIVRLGHELNLRVVAEGVEDSDSLEWLGQVGCDYAQGYYFARPLTAGELVGQGWLTPVAKARKRVRQTS
nr:EAL domain-containing protein [Wenzhouxiangella sp. XN201]